MTPCTLWVKNVKAFEIRFGEDQIGIVIPGTVCLVDEENKPGDLIRVIPDVFISEGGFWKNNGPDPAVGWVWANNIYAISDKEASENIEK